jgi:hypothetical protein
MIYLRQSNCPLLHCIQMIILGPTQEEMHFRNFTPTSSGQSHKGMVLVTFTRYRRKGHFLRHLCIKRIILPRQARDKHRESTQKKMALCIACRYRRPRAGQRRYSERKRKDVFLSRLYIKTIFLPGQARSIGKSTQKQTTVFFSGQLGGDGSGRRHRNRPQQRRQGAVSSLFSHAHKFSSAMKRGN